MQIFISFPQSKFYPLPHYCCLAVGPNVPLIYSPPTGSSHIRARPHPSAASFTSTMTTFADFIEKHASISMNILKMCLV